MFNGDGKIYEASASRMFNIPISEIGKGSELRMKGKISELALGYGGSVGALTTMGALRMGLSEDELPHIVNRWRAANKKIVNLWKLVENCAKKAVRYKKKVVAVKGIEFNCFFDEDLEHNVLTIKLPSGRQLIYQGAHFGLNKFNSQSVKYLGINSARQWGSIDTYGGKLVENIVQAIARDLLCSAIESIEKENFKIVMHVHDEVVIEMADFYHESKLKIICGIMGRDIPWAEGLPLDADGYTTKFYKKD